MIRFTIPLTTPSLFYCIAMPKQAKLIHICLLVFSLLWPSVQSFAANNPNNPNIQNLPSLGDHTSGIISLAKERELGQGFLRSIRAQAPLVKDPVLQEYLELLIYRLASHSQLQDRRLDLVIIDNKTINAFAAPGGIVGINLGLFLFGETESEISAILAHELAHLSQRHFARGAEAGKKTGLISIAGLLAGLVLMATTGGEAGLAAITASNSLAQNNILRYSRGRETEADRVGIYTLIEAEMNPRAMAHMFERLSHASRFSGRNIPEFLRTHPVTKNRIADSYIQTESQPIKDYQPVLDFQLMRTRVLVRTAGPTIDIVAQMEDRLKTKDQVLLTAARYGVALAKAKKGQLDSSMRHILALREEYPEKITFVITEAELHMKAERFDSAIEVLQDALTISPNNYPLTMTYADALMKNRQASEAVRVLTDITTSRPNDKDAWYSLAEAQGLNRNTVGVHLARAEFFVLIGNFDQAIKQLGFAYPMVKDNFQKNARVQQRIEEIFLMKMKERH
ncbi:MAG: M48 family metallopeptidase [Pseudomonadales bacterium]|nr:M48 family metallopeptidase [Pseudomonadales bacterium]